MFTAEKVAQMAAFFAEKSGGTVHLLKLMKLLYLADRKSMELTGAPISFDRLVSMDKGPALSRTLDLINGSFVDDIQQHWDAWIGARSNDHTVSLNREFERRDLNQLSEEDLEILAGVWDELGRMDRFELVKYTHDHCKEWRDPRGSSLPIHEREIFTKGFGVPRKKAVELQRQINYQREMDRVINLP